MYQITEYTKTRAKKLGVKVKPSSDPKKKIDVFKDREKIASIGATGYGDFPTFIKEKGIEYAKERQRLYKKRFQKQRKIIGSNSMLSSLLLW